MDNRGSAPLLLHPGKLLHWVSLACSRCIGVALLASDSQGSTMMYWQRCRGVNVAIGPLGRCEGGRSETQAGSSRQRPAIAASLSFMILLSLRLIPQAALARQTLLKLVASYFGVILWPIPLVTHTERHWGWNENVPWAIHFRTRNQQSTDRKWGAAK